MLLIHIAHSMNRLNLSHLTQFIGILLLCKTEMRRAVPSTQVTLHCQCQCSEGKCFHWRSLSTFHCDYIVVKLREREGQGVDPGRSLKGHLWMVDGGIPFPDALH